MRITPISAARKNFNGVIYFPRAYHRDCENDVKDLMLPTDQIGPFYADVENYWCTHGTSITTRP